MIRSTSIPINELTNPNKTTGRIVLSFRWSDNISLVAAVIVPTKACHLVVARASTGERPVRTNAGTVINLLPPAKASIEPAVKVIAANKTSRSSSIIKYDT